MSRPTTLELALIRIDELEHQLGLIDEALLKRVGINVDELLKSANISSLHAINGDASFSKPTPAAQQPQQVTVDHGDSSEPANTVDMGPLVLKALQIRKQVQHGEIDEQDAAQHVQALVEDAGGVGVVTEAQVHQLNQWAGITH
ncbi:hypothetical protein OIO90_001168 [Microbotryomycetes sp. JL221]|nr:hypothetical protein OIO90_001168 [Microbotryomycetes sp. JL221]